MLYDQLIAIIDSHKHEIARDLIKRANDQPSQQTRLPSTTPMEIRILSMVAWLDTMLLYIRDGDSERWRTEIIGQTERILHFKYPIDEMLKVSETTYQVIDQLIDQEVKDEKLRERFHRRVQGLNTSTSTIARVVVMRANNENSK